MPTDNTNGHNKFGLSTDGRTLTFINSTVTLFDDGLHGDDAANDGVYANYFTNTINDGSYTFTVKAEGTASQGGTFMRENTISTFVKPCTSCPPSVVSVDPNSGQQGQTLDITITGDNFASGAIVSFSGTGVSVNSAIVNTLSEILANITIASDAPTGPRDLTVTNPDGRQGLGHGLFTVNSCDGPFSFFDDFEDGNPDDWLANDPSKWDVESVNSNSNLVYCLSKANEQGDEYSLLRTKWKDFVLDLDARATTNKNILIIFGVQSFTNSTDTGYYLKFSIGKVELFQAANAKGVVIASTSDDFVSDGNFHHIKIERQFPNIKVTVDGKLLFAVDDNTFAEGYIGVGSRKSRACFDNVSVTGIERCEGAYFTLPDRAVRGLAYDFRVVWAIHSQEGGSGDVVKISKINAETGKILLESKNFNWNGRGITVGEGSLWIADALADDIHRVDPSNFNVISSFKYYLLAQHHRQDCGKSKYWHIQKSRSRWCGWLRISIKNFDANVK